MLSDFQYCIQLMLKNQVHIKTHPKNFNDKYHDFHCIAQFHVVGFVPVCADNFRHCRLFFFFFFSEPFAIIVCRLFGEVHVMV